MRKSFAVTNNNLLRYSLEPSMRWLIAVALDGSTLTYGQLRDKLEKEAGFSKIFTTRVKFIVGCLMELIQEIEPEAPLINVLVVSQADRQPSKGAGGFMAKRFGHAKLKETGAKKRYPNLWKQTFEQAAGEVYTYKEEYWSDLFNRVFGKTLDRNEIKRLREGRHQGTEEDGIPTGRKYGKGGEGPFHEALRLWVMENPQEIDADFDDVTAETEVDLDSGDRVDVVFKSVDQTIVLEVKSRISNEVDLLRGVYQCVKYRAVRAAMDVRHGAVVKAFLVTENPLPGNIADLVKLHDIRHVQAPLDRG